MMNQPAMMRGTLIWCREDLEPYKMWLQCLVGPQKAVWFSGGCSSHVLLCMKYMCWNWRLWFLQAICAWYPCVSSLNFFGPGILFCQVALCACLWCCLVQGSMHFKFGVLYCKANQTEDDDFFSNGKVPVSARAALWTWCGCDGMQVLKTIATVPTSQILSLASYLCCQMPMTCRILCGCALCLQKMAVPSLTTLWSFSATGSSWWASPNIVVVWTCGVSISAAKYCTLFILEWSWWGFGFGIECVSCHHYSHLIKFPPFCLFSLAEVLSWLSEAVRPSKPVKYKLVTVCSHNF